MKTQCAQCGFYGCKFFLYLPDRILAFCVSAHRTAWFARWVS